MPKRPLTRQQRRQLARKEKKSQLSEDEKKVYNQLYDHSYLVGNRRFVKIDGDVYELIRG